VTELQARVDRSAAWVAMASVVLGVLDVLSTLICLRLWVSTADFGAATLAIALFPILDRVGGMGLGAAVVREADPSAEGLSSIFWLGLAVSAAVFATLVATRSWIGAWFPDPVVGSLLAAYGGRLIMQQLSMVPEALMKRELRYRELSVIRTIAGLVETTTKLGLAALGAHGFPALAIWCFALGPIANTAVTTLGVQLCQPWRPRLACQRAIAARAARFTAAISGGELLYFAYTSADYLVIGACFGSAAVGAYRLAYELVLDVVRLLSMVTAEVAFPAFVRLAADRRAVAAHLVRFTRQNLIVLAAFLVFVAIEADDLLALLYPPLPPGAATAARVLCIVGALRTLGFILPAMLAGLGEARRVLAYHLVATIVLPAAFVVASRAAPAEGFVAVAWAWAAGYPIAFGVLLAMALPRATVPVGAYLRALGGVTACAAGALAAGLVVRGVAGGVPAVRALAVALVVVLSYLGLLARLERITPAAIVRSLRGRA